MAENAPLENGKMPQDATTAEMVEDAIVTLRKGLEEHGESLQFLVFTTTQDSNDIFSIGRASNGNRRIVAHAILGDLA